MIPNLEKKLSIARQLTWASYFLFIISLLTGGLVSGTPASLLIIVTLPLVIFLPGMARENDKTLVMLSFVTLLYFIPIVVNVGEPDNSIFDIFSLVLICVLFTSSMFFSRWKRYHQLEHRVDVSVGETSSPELTAPHGDKKD